MRRCARALTIALASLLAAGTACVAQTAQQSSPPPKASGKQGEAQNHPTPYEELQQAIDGAGNAWVTNDSGSSTASVTKLSSAGAAVSPATGFVGGGLGHPFDIAIDGTGSAWKRTSARKRTLAIRPSIPSAR